MSLEEKVLESVRNLKAMAEQCIDLATKVADELTKEKETKREEKRLRRHVGDLKENQVFLFNNRTFKLLGDHLPAFVPSHLSVRTGDDHKTGFMAIHLFTAIQISPVVPADAGNGYFYFSGDLLVLVSE